ncbi:unnamed protein product [Cochlearia groenlandica]
MAETLTSSPLKRQREENQEKENITQEETKRQKPCSSSSCSSSSSYDQVQCLLEQDNDLTSFITTLHQETSKYDQNATVLENLAISSSSSYEEEEEKESDKEKVMKHLLEASDDELGIPNIDIGESNYEMIKSETNQKDYYYVNEFSLLDGFSDGLWELEDEAANYYTLLQSELFM